MHSLSVKHIRLFQVNSKVYCLLYISITFSPTSDSYAEKTIGSDDPFVLHLTVISHHNILEHPIIFGCCCGCGAYKESSPPQKTRKTTTTMHPIKDLVNHFVDVTDVDGVLRRIDVNDVVDRIDINKVIQRVDFNTVLSKIDWNAQLDKIDWNAQLERIDWDQIVSKVNANAIIAKSSTGMVSSFIDTMRLQLTMMDLYLRILTRCLLWKEEHRQQIYLPPKPGRHRQRNDRQLYPQGRMNKAIAVQGRYCGFVSKAIAIGIDIFTITIVFALIFRLAQWCLVLFLRIPKDEAKNKTNAFQFQDTEAMLLLYCTGWFLYFFGSVTLAGQTVGMAIVGIKLCNCNRTSNPYSTVSMKQAFLRTCLLPITLTFCPPLGLIGLIRRDGRMFHDLVADTGMIYLWNAKLTKLRNDAMKQDENDIGSSTFFKDDDTYDELDGILDVVVVMEDDKNGPRSSDRIPTPHQRQQQQDTLLHRTSETAGRQYSTFDPNQDSDDQKSCFHII